MQSTNEPKRNDPRHGTPEFREYIRKLASKGGKSRSLRKIDACRENGAKGGRKGGLKRGPKLGMKVPPLNCVEVQCAGMCGFSMTLTAQAMELNTRGRALVWTCPDCGHTGNRVEPRTCPSPVMLKVPVMPPRAEP